MNLRVVTPARSEGYEVELLRRVHARKVVVQGPLGEETYTLRPYGAWVLLGNGQYSGVELRGL